MFGVGIHFSVRDLLAVRHIAVPGAIGQILVASVLGTVIGLMLGWGIGGALVLGLAVSVASTVVLLRALMDRGELDTPQGRIAVGWLIVENLFTVLVLVLLPGLTPFLLDPSAAPVVAATGAAALPSGSTGAGPVADLLVALAKATVFAALMIVAGARFVPRLLAMVAREGSRELFTLSVLALALGIAYVASVVFGVSFALGAFLAGAVVSESDMSHQAAADALPLRDAFAVLFFVSVGMLVDPGYLVANPLPILAVVLLVVVAKSIAAFGIVAVFGYPSRVGLTVAAGLAQVGEFSFILASAGLVLGLLPPEGFQLIVAASFLSIALNPFVFRTIEPLDDLVRDWWPVIRLQGRRAGALAQLVGPERETLRQHAVVCGYGRVGQMVGPVLERRGFRYVVVTQQRVEVERLRRRGIPAIYGDAAHPEVLEQAQIRDARLLVVAISDPHENRRIVEQARRLHPDIDIVTRTHSDAEAAHFRALGGHIQAVYGERELAVQMVRYALRRFGVSGTEAEAIAQGLRSRAAAPVHGEPSAASRSLLDRLRDRLPGGGSD